MFFIVVVIVVVVQFRHAYLKHQVRYGDETLHNPWQVVQELFFSILFTCKQLKTTKNSPRQHIMI